MEEEYYTDLQRYYDSLQMGLPMDYYQGRNDPDLTPWLTYFLGTMTAAAERVRDRALQLRTTAPPRRAPWEGLTRRQQQLLSRLVLTEPEEKGVPSFTPGDIATWFMVSAKTARQWLQDWHDEGFTLPASGEERIRSWRVNSEFEHLLTGVRKAARTQQ
jgi:Fic family protein